MLLRNRNLQLIAVADLSALHKNISLHDAVELAVKGGVSMVLLREDHLGKEALMREAVRLKILCGMYDIPFLVMNRLDIAQAVDADGVVVDGKDFDARAIRRMLGADRCIGVFIRTPEEARKAEEQGAAFLFEGPIRDRENEEESITTDELMEVCAAVRIPVVAYGGIADDDLNALRGTGICGIGVATGIFSQPDIEGAARNLRKLAADVL